MISEVKRDKSAKLKENDLSPLPYFDWDKAKYFYYVARLKSFSQAGQFLKISQSGLSRKVQTLESHIGFRVFNRNQKGVELTRKGEQLFDIVESTFLSLKKLNFNAETMEQSQNRRHIRLLATHAMAVYVLKRHILKYNKDNPSITFEIITDDYIVDLHLQDVDIAIRPYDKKTKGIIQESFFKFEKKLFASQEYLEKFGEPCKVEDLKDHHIIIPARTNAFPYSNLDWISTLGLEANKKHVPIFESTSIEYSVEAAREGLGIVAGYEEMDIIRNSGLTRILKNIQGPVDEDFIIYPEYLKDDEILTNLKNYLINNCFNSNFIDTSKSC